MCEGTLCFEKTWVMNSWASWVELMVSWVGMKRDCLVRQSMTMSMEVKPSAAGRCSMKSMEMEFHGFFGIGSCLSLPYGLWHGALVGQQFLHELSNVFPIFPKQAQ